MDILDKFFKKFAYKFDKGYPDMNNSQDVLLLESLFEKLGVELELKEDKVPRKKETIQAVAKIVDQVGSKYSLFPMKSNLNRIGSIGKQPESIFVQAFKEVFGDDNLRATASVKEHTLTLDHLSNNTAESIYDGTQRDLNKVRINDMCKMATDAGFTVVDQYIWRYDLEHDHFLTNEIKNELSQYSSEELLCSSHTLILKKN